MDYCTIKLTGIQGYATVNPGYVNNRQGVMWSFDCTVFRVLVQIIQGDATMTITV
jgi:hypothetical protein